MDSSQFDKLMNKLDDLTKRITKLEKENSKFKDEIKDIIILENSLMTEIGNKIETKLDLFGNMEFNNNTKQVTKANKKVTPLVFLKQELKEDLNKFIDILYTIEDIENLKEKKEVKSKKTEVDKTTKIISLLYSEVIKKNEDALGKLKELLNEYSQQSEIST
jgi:hypothetical protein